MEAAAATFFAPFIGVKAIEILPQIISRGRAINSIGPFIAIAANNKQIFLPEKSFFSEFQIEI